MPETIWLSPVLNSTYTKWILWTMSKHRLKAIAIAKRFSARTTFVAIWLFDSLGTQL